MNLVQASSAVWECEALVDVQGNRGHRSRCRNSSTSATPAARATSGLCSLRPRRSPARSVPATVTHCNLPFFGPPVTLQVVLASRFAPQVVAAAHQEPAVATSDAICSQAGNYRKLTAARSLACPECVEGNSPPWLFRAIRKTSSHVSQDTADDTPPLCRIPKRA